MKKIFAKILCLLSCLTFLVCGITALSYTFAYADEKTGEQVEKIADVYLVAGQSNAEGCSLVTGGKGPIYETQTSSSFYNPTLKYENVLYNHNVLLNLSGGSYMITDLIPVVQGLGWNYQKTHIGPELGMAQSLDPIYAQKENTDAIIIKVADGGTSLVRHYDSVNVDLNFIAGISEVDANSGTWYPESLWNVLYDDGSKADLWESQLYHHPTGYLYRELITFLRTNYNILQEKGYTKINFKAFCWMQGESDVAQYKEYKKVFNVFASDIRTRLSEITGEDYSSLPMVIGELGATYPSRSYFVDVQREIPLSLGNSYVIDSEKFAMSEMGADEKSVILGSDGAHWNYPDMVEVGKLFGEQSYKASAEDNWLYIDVGAKRSDRYDKTSLENVKLDIDEFNDNGKLSFSCDLKKLYNITSLSIGEIDLMPYVTHSVNGNYRTYTVNGVNVDNTQDATVEAFFTNADTYTVSVSIAQEGNSYGDKIYTYENKVYANAGYYELNAHPTQDGRVYKVTINGVEVAGAKNSDPIIIDNIFDYPATDDKKFKIEVQYSKIPEPKIVASGYVISYEAGEAFSTDGLVVKFVDALENETVLDKDEYTVDSSTFNPNQVGKYLITITYGDYKYNYTVDVVAPKIEIENAKTLFLIGEQFSIGEAKVYLVTKAGKTLLEEGQYTVTTVLFNSKYAGTYDILVSGQGASGTYKVQVVAPDSIEVSGAKTEFSGEEFSTGDIVVKAKVGDDEYLLDASSYTVDSTQFNKDESGTYTITVSACGKSATYEVTVTVSGGNTETPEKGESGSSSSGCGANAMEIFTLVAGLCALAFVFKKSR